MTTTLSPAQCSALFDILTHSDTYSEIQHLRTPGSLSTSGPPFTKQSTPSTTPALQKLLEKYACNGVGIRDVPPEYWNVQIRGIMDGLQEANLSESYDKGSIGNRKTVATAIGALLEYPTRGVFGGIKNRETGNREYNLGNAEDLERAWADFCSEVVWGNGLDDMFQKASETDKLEEYPMIFQAMGQYMTVHVASVLHYMLVSSPQGQYLLGLMENSFNQIPWGIVKQTLKLGNAATMTNAMMKILLAKFTNEGMNLNQRIIASTFGGDIKEFEKKASKIEKDKILSKEYLQCLKDYPNKTRDEQEQIRQQSHDFCISIVDSILISSSLPTNLGPTAHEAALAYLNYQLSIRDRREIVRVLCRSNPDNLTAMLRMQIEAMDPIIRRAHKATDLSSSCGDLQAFLKDLFKVAKIQVAKGSDEAVIPSVADFVQVLRKHRYNLDKFHHQILKNDPEMAGWFLEFAKESVKQFRDGTASSPHSDGAGKMAGSLNELFSSVPPGNRQQMIEILDKYAQYLKQMDATTTQRLQKTLDAANRKSKNPVLEKILKKDTKKEVEEEDEELEREESPTKLDLVSDLSEMSIGNKSIKAAELESGPGGYLVKWRDLMNMQKITIKETNGAHNGKISQNRGEDDDRPDTSMIEDMLGAKFRQMLGVKGKDW